MGKEHKRIYLTFDDGPCQRSTSQILDMLRQFSIRATFFCTGTQALKYKNLFEKIIESGHTIGNHTYSHISSWNCSPDTYFADIKKFENEVWQTKLFRPPYGHIPFRGLEKIQKNYSIVMWSLMAWDFDSVIRPEKIVKVLSEKTRNGSIWVFHDQEKAVKISQIALPQLIEKFLEKGFEFDCIPEKLL